MKRFHLAWALAALVGLGGCATTGGPADLTYVEQQRMSALNQAIRQRSGGGALDLLFVVIPSPDNALADHLFISRIKSGSSSNAMNTLLKLLQTVPGAQVVVHGQSDAATAAK